MEYSFNTNTSYFREMFVGRKQVVACYVIKRFSQTAVHLILPISNYISNRTNHQHERKMTTGQRR